MDNSTIIFTLLPVVYILFRYLSNVSAQIAKEEEEILREFFTKLERIKQMGEILKNKISEERVAKLRETWNTKSPEEVEQMILNGEISKEDLDEIGVPKDVALVDLIEYITDDMRIGGHISQKLTGKAFSWEC